MNEKVKKSLIVAACVLLGVVFIVAISNNFKKPAKEQDVFAESSTAESTEVKPEIKRSEIDKTNEEKKEESQTETESSEPEETVGEESQPESVQDKGQNIQEVQPAPTKPPAPSKEVISNPTEKPDGEKVEGDPVPEIHEEVQQPETNTVPGAKPEGESQEGKIYAPGFGWIDDIGEGQGIDDSSIYENGNKIGSMD